MCEYKGNSNLPLIFFFVRILFKFFSPIPVFDPIFSFLIYYSLISNIASDILKIFLLFPMSSIDRDYNKKRIQHLQINSVNNSDKNFFCFEYLLVLHKLVLRREENKKDEFKSTSFTLNVSNNDVGIPDNFEIECINSLGFQLKAPL
jgi:hypothetical protein